MVDQRFVGWCWDLERLKPSKWHPDFRWFKNFGRFFPHFAPVFEVLKAVIPRSMYQWNQHHPNLEDEAFKLQLWKKTRKGWFGSSWLNHQFKWPTPTKKRSGKKKCFQSLVGETPFWGAVFLILIVCRERFNFEIRQIASLMVHRRFRWEFQTNFQTFKGEKRIGDFCTKDSCMLILFHFTGEWLHLFLCSFKMKSLWSLISC